MHKIAITLVLMIFNSFGSLYAMNIWDACTIGDIEQMDIWDACTSGNIKKVKLLIEQDSTLVNAQHFFTRTPLASASYWGQTKIVAFLLQHNADVNAQDSLEETPLHDASYKCHPKTIKLLLSHGATPHKPINLFIRFKKYSQTYAQRYESWICKTFLPRKTIALLLSLIGRKKITDTPLLPKDICNLIANAALSDQEREREESSQNSNHQDPVLEWEQFKNDNPDVAALARIELP